MYLFAGSSSSWQQAGDAIKPTAPVANQNFGHSVSIYGDMIAVGAPGPSSVPYQKGSVHVYAKETLFIWKKAGNSLTPSGTEAGEARFGQSVAATATQIITGADNYDMDASGAVYVYH